MEHLDVVVIGAGLSGIGAAHYLSTQCPWAEFAVFEARDNLGGTWDLFRYPGIRSDSDMFTLGYSFRPWDQPISIADGASILRYIHDTAVEDGTDSKIRYHHRVVSAKWSTPDARWTITALRTDTNEEVVLSASYLFSCTGYYRYDRGYLPEFEGLDSFGGTVIHPQFWPEDFDYTGKRVVVIGSGATAITLIPAMATSAGHVTMLQRSPTYVVSLPNHNPATKVLRKVLPQRFEGSALRWFNALSTQTSYYLSRRRPALVRKVLMGGVAKQLPEGYDVDTHFSPRYNPWDQRLCVVPDGDLFAAIRAGNASVVTDQIVRITPTGIELASGDTLPADVIVTATGLDLLFLGGIELSVDGVDVDVSKRLTYKGMALEGVPNLGLAIGYANASWTLKAELTFEYVCRLLNHMRTSATPICTPICDDADATDDGALFGLSSGYVVRAVDRMPKQGSKFPWRVSQSYVRDFRALKRSDVVDDSMRFTRPDSHELVSSASK